MRYGRAQEQGQTDLIHVGSWDAFHKTIWGSNFLPNWLLCYKVWFDSQIILWNAALVSLTWIQDMLFSLKSGQYVSPWWCFFKGETTWCWWVVLSARDFKVHRSLCWVLTLNVHCFGEGIVSPKAAPNTFLCILYLNKIDLNQFTLLLHI